MSHRNPKVLGIWGDEGTRPVAAESYWRAPLRWAEEARQGGRLDRVFCGSLMDVGEDRPELAAPRRRLVELIAATADGLAWLLLTKRPENLARLYPEDVLARVAVGTTVEDQTRALDRLYWLTRTRARWRFVSAEPLLGEVDLTPWLAPDLLDWVIVGGESGAGARPMHPRWVDRLRMQCQAAAVPFFFKQWGEWQDGSATVAVPHRIMLTDGRALSASEYRRTFSKTPDDLYPTCVARVGKARSGRLLNGREWNQAPRAMAAPDGRGPC
jgi:protein gp37